MGPENVKNVLVKKESEKIFNRCVEIAISHVVVIMVAEAFFVLVQFLLVLFGKAEFIF